MAPVADRHQDVPLVAARWSVRGNEPGAPFTFRYCCTGGGVAETSIALAEGTYFLGITHASSECQRAIHPLVSPARAEHVMLADALAWGRIAVARIEVPHEYAGDALRLRLVIEGGLHCCGATTIERIEIVRS